jgi:hypothetical protein
MKKNRDKQKFKGMSLIETILYLGIAVFVLGMIFTYGLNITGLGVKTGVVRETLSAAEILRERIISEIRSAQSVERGASNFGGDPAKLVINTGSESVTIEDASGQITIKRGNSDPIVLHSNDIRIGNLIFTEQISAEDETEYVGFSFEVAADYPGSDSRSEYQYSMPIRSGAAIRNK